MQFLVIKNDVQRIEYWVIGFSFEIPDFCRVIVDESEARIHFHAIEIEKE